MKKPGMEDGVTQCESAKPTLKTVERDGQPPKAQTGTLPGGEGRKTFKTTQ